MSMIRSLLRSRIAAVVISSLVTAMVLATAVAVASNPGAKEQGLLQAVRAAPPLDQVRVYSASNQAIPVGVDTPLSFELERWDTAALHSNTTNTSRLTATRAGLYEISGNVVWNIGSGSRYVLIKLNGTTIIAAQQSSGTGFAMHGAVATTYRLGVGDYVELAVFSDTAGQTVLAAPNYSPEFAMTRLSS